ncbi:MAG TPA: TonB-dependent receptor [Pyrinomonadaceae bacterium]|nr:TonB-dependent receptor [Pyrinomonadaceae bacterium]
MKIRSKVFVAFVFALSLFANVFAQDSGGIAGTVTDESGAKIPGAEVVLTAGNGIQLNTSTDHTGNFEFKNLRSGSYFVEVKAEGFSVFTSEEIHFNRGENKQIAVQLKIAAINASVVVTATGTVQRADEVSKVVSTIDSQEIEAKHELSLSEALRGTPGLRVQQQGSPGSLTTLRLRGQRNFDTSLLLDGLRVRDAGDINGSAVSLLADLVPVSLDRIEVLRGAGSSIYGTHAIGGVINMIPDVGSSGFRLTAGFDGGSLATYRERLQASGGGERLGFELGVNRLDVRNGIDGDDEYGNTGFAGRLQFNASPSIMIAANLFGNIANARLNDSPFALPAAFTTSGLFPKAVAGVTFQPDFNNPDQGRRNRLLVGSGRFSQVVSDTVSYSVAYQRVSSDRRNYNGPRVDPRFASFVPFGDFEFLNVNDGDTDTVDARTNIHFSRSNLLTTGFEFEHESLFQSSQPSFTFFNNTTDRQRTFAIFGQDQLSLLDDRLRLSLGVRGQWYRIRSADRPGILRGREAESSITGDGSVAYFIRNSGTKLRAHVGNGFRAPALFERFGEGTFGSAGVVRFGDPTLKAEQSISADGGFDQRVGNDRVLFGATYFYTRLQRLIAFTGFAVDPLGLGRFSGFVNRPGGLSRGVETYFNTSPVKGLDLRASYTFTNSDRAIPGLGLQPEYVIPKHLFGLTLTQRYRSLLFNFDLNRTGSYLAPVFENNIPFRMADLTFSGYTKADVFVSYERRQTERVTMVLFGGVENVFNQTYYENGFLAPRALGRGGIRISF